MTKIIVSVTIAAVLASAAFKAYEPLIREAKEAVQKTNSQTLLIKKAIDENKK